MTSETTAPSCVELEVAGEPGVYWCARHRKTKTRLRCGRCETPICPKCTRQGPTGARCLDCASNRSAHIYQVSPLQYLSAFAVAVVLGAVGSTLVTVVGFFFLFFAPTVGPLLGRAVTFATRGKRGPRVAAVVSAGLVLGALATALVPALLVMAAVGRLHLPGQPPPHMAFPLGALLNPYLWIFIALAVPGVWWWLK